MLAEEKAECERDVSRLDIKLFASKQEIEDLQEKLEIASMNQSLLEKERDSLIKERQRKMELAEKEQTTGDKGSVLTHFGMIHFGIICDKGDICEKDRHSKDRQLG